MWYHAWIIWTELLLKSRSHFGPGHEPLRKQEKHWIDHILIYWSFSYNEHAVSASHVHDSRLYQICLTSSTVSLARSASQMRYLPTVFVCRPCLLTSSLLITSSRIGPFLFQASGCRSNQTWLKFFVFIICWCIFCYGCMFAFVVFDWVFQY